MTNNKIGVLTQRMDRGESDLRNAEGRISALENCHSEIQVSLAKLPRKILLSLQKKYGNAGRRIKNGLILFTLGMPLEQWQRLSSAESEF
jgi:hypothetical protein